MAGKGLGERDKAHLQCLCPVALFVCQGSDILLIFLWFQPVPERCSENRDVTVHLGCRLWWSLWMYLLYLFQKFFFTSSGGCWSFLWQVGGQSRNASSRYISDSSAAVPLAFISAVGDYSGDRQFGGGNVASVLNTKRQDSLELFRAYKILELVSRLYRTIQESAFPWSYIWLGSWHVQLVIGHFPAPCRNIAEWNVELTVKQMGVSPTPHLPAAS